MCICVREDVWVCAFVQAGWGAKEAEMWLFLTVQNTMINTQVCMLLYCNDCHFKTSFLPSSYRGKDLRENYCRNPRGEEGGPWCFTTSPETRHEVCDIPLCSQGNPAQLSWKVPFYLFAGGKQNFRQFQWHLLMDTGERIGIVSARITPVARKAVIWERGDLVMFQYSGRFEKAFRLSSFSSSHEGTGTMKACWSHKCDPVFHLSNL